MQLSLYNAIKAQLETLTELKYVALFNNQFELESENISFGYPCVLIEFSNISYSDFLNGVQKYQMNVNLHIGFESYKTEDTSILTLKQNVQAKMFQFQNGYETKMLRRAEVQNFNHNNIQEYVITYSVSGKDYADSLPATEADVDTLVTTISPQIQNDIIKTGIPL